ncbi:MAG: PEP-CTERM sorting domain-containing protein, partial [Rhodoferax sp.]|nr:PEP-CTERM sorting domain-containing protein [Rhodoferax sp.]
LSNNGTWPTVDDLTVAAVPEPGTYAMLLAGLAAVGFVARRRNV